MTTTRFEKIGAAGLRWALSCLLIAVCSVTSWSQGGGTNNGSSPSDPSTNASSPGEEVTSLPMLDAPGLTLVGGQRELRALAISLHGRGQVLVGRIGRDTFVVTLSGDYVVELDRAALARSSVLVLFHGGSPFQGGLARLQVGSSSPQVVSAERVLLPIARLAATPQAQGTLVTLNAVGQRTHQAHVEAAFSRERVTLLQRLR